MRIFHEHGLENSILGITVLAKKQESRAGCFALIVFLMSCDCKCSVALPHGAVGWSAVCDCGISWSYALTFCTTRLSIGFLKFLNTPRCNFIRTYHECEGAIEKSIPRITVWHHEASLVMPNRDREARIFLSDLYTNNGFFFLLITKCKKKRQISGIDTIKHFTWTRTPHGKVTK